VRGKIVSSSESGGDPLGGIGDRWARLVAFLASASSLPTTPDAFTARYGVFPDAGEVDAFVASIARLNDLAIEAGGSAALKLELSADPADLQGGAPTAPLFSRVVWLANRIFNVADNAANTLSGLTQLLAPSAGDVVGRARALKQVLAGPGGLTEAFAQVRVESTQVETALGAFATRVAALSRQLAESKLLNQANVAVGEVNNANRRLAQQKPIRPSRDEDTDPIPDPAEQMAANQAEVARKEAFVRDSTALFSSNDKAGTLVPEIAAAMAALALRFQRAANQLVQFCAISTEAQLADAAWVSQALELPAMVAGWRGLGEAAQCFTQRALIEPAGAGS
jgi:hypothetical protein